MSLFIETLYAVSSLYARTIKSLAPHESEDSLKVVKAGGKIVSLPTHTFPEALQAAADAAGVALEFVMVQSNGDDMNTLKGMLESGALRAHVSVTFPFAKIADAHKQIESGHTIGKAVVIL